MTMPPSPYPSLSLLLPRPVPPALTAFLSLPLLAAALRSAVSGEVAELLAVVVASVSGSEGRRTSGVSIERVLIVRKQIDHTQRRGHGEDLTGRLCCELDGAHGRAIGRGEEADDEHLVLLIGEGAARCGVLQTESRELLEDGLRVRVFDALERVHLRQQVGLDEVTLAVVARADGIPHHQ